MTIGTKVVLCLVKADAEKAEVLTTYVKLKVKLGGIDYVTSNVSEQLDANSI